jgi:hypothetical protein
MKNRTTSKGFLKGGLLLGALVLFHLATPAANARTCTSNATGNWSAATTWASCGGGTPVAGDTIKIINPYTVTIDVANAAAATIQVGGTVGSGTATLTFNSGSQLTITNAVTLGGATSTLNAVINMTNGGKLIAGSLALASSANTKTWTPGTGTVQLSASNTLPATIFTSFNNLTISSGTTTLSAATTLSGTMLLSGGILKSNNFNLGIAGDWTNNAATTAFTAGTATVTFNGSTAQAIGGTFATSFNHLTLSNTANTVTLAVNANVAGNLSVTSGTFDLATFTANRTAAGGTLTVANNATLKIGGTNSFPSNYTTNTLVVASLVEYSGTNQTVANKLYGNLKLSSSGGAAVKTLPATTLTIAGDLNSVVGAGTSVSFTAAANIAINGSLSLGGSCTFNGGSYALGVGSNWTNNGTFNGNTGTVTLSGAGASVGGSGSQNFNNLTVTGSSVSFSNSSMTIAGNLATSGSGSLTVAAGGTFLMTGTGKTIDGAGISVDNLDVSGSLSTTSSLQISGNLSISGSLNCTAGTVTMSGTSSAISGSGTKSFAGLDVTGSVTTAVDVSISGGLTVGGSLTASSGTTTFTGSATVSGPANLYNVNLNGTSLQLSANSTLGIAGALTVTAGTLNPISLTPNTVNFNGTGAQSVNALTYNNLTLSNGDTKTAAGSMTVNGDLSIGAGTTFAAGAYTHSLYGNWNNAGSFTAGTGTVEFLGDQATTLLGATTFNVLTVNRTTDATSLELQSNVSAATVNMTSGRIYTGSSTLTITTTRTGNGDIYGTIQRTHSFTTGVAYAFEGPNNSITFASVSGVTSITVNVLEGTVADFPFGGSVNEQYTITIPAGTYNATLRLDYDDDELNGNAESTMTLWSYNGSAWVNAGKTNNDTTANYVEHTGLTSITTRWTFSDPNAANVVEWNGSVSSDWNTAANWTTIQGSPSKPPTANDIVYLGSAAFTNNPTISSAATAKNIRFGSVQALTLTLASGGSLTSNSIEGAWTSNASHTINAGNQTVTINGGLTLSDGTDGHNINLTIGSGTVNVEGELSQSGGATVSFTGNGSLNLEGDYDYVAGTFTPGSGTVTYNGSSNQVVAGLTYGNLVINKAAAAAINSPVTVNGNLTITAGEIDNYSTTTVYGSVTIGSGAELHNHSLFHTKGNWTNNGTFVATATASMFFDGDGTQYIAASTFNNLNINKPVGTSAVLTGNCIVNSNINLLSGTLDLQSYTCNRSIQGGSLTLSNLSTLIVGSNNFPANFTTNVLDAASTVVFNGSSAQTIAGENFGNLVFRNGGLKTLAAPLTVNGNLTIENGATLDGSTQTLTLDGNWINNGAFTPSTSSVLMNGSGKTVSGDTTFNAVTVAGSYTVAGSNITYGGPLDVTATGNYNLGSGTAIFNADLTNSGSLTSTGIATLSGTTQQTLRFINSFSAQSTGTVNFNGSISPILNFNITPSYGDLNINNTGGINCDVGWVIYGTMTVGAGAAFNGGNSSHNFYGNIVNNGAITSSGSLNLLPTAAATVNMGSTFSSSGLVNFGGGGEVTLAGTPSSFNDVVIANTNAAGITPSSDWTLTNNLTVNSGAILNAGSRTFTVGGNISNSGTINSSTATFILNGAAAQDLYSASAFKNLTVNKSAEVVSLSSDVTVSGVLNFIAGKIQTGTNRLIQPAGGTVTGAGQSTGWVNGQLQKNIATGNPSTTFAVGGPNNYTPITVDFSNVSTAGDLTASASAGDHASIATSTINAAQSVNRTWTLANSGLVFTNYNATFNFVAGDLDGGVNTNAVIVGEYNGSSWTYATVGAKTSTSTQASGLTTFGDFQIGATTSIPNVTLTASVSPNGFVRPRTDLVYTLSFTNNGVGSAYGFVISDPVPPNTDFKLGSATTSLGTTGLTPTISYSNDGGASWTYSPVSGAGGAPAGYDRNVTNVRWNFGSTLSQTAPNNTGSVAFSARIR